MANTGEHNDRRSGPRDDLPDAPGLVDLGPLGSLVERGGEAVRIQKSISRFDPGRVVPVEDAGPLLEAARLVSEGLVLESRHAHAAQRALLSGWVERALGAPLSALSIGGAERVLGFDGALVLLLEHASVVACASPERLRALLACSPRGPLSLCPARYSYSALDARPRPGAPVGAVSHVGLFLPEALDLFEAEGGCWARGALQGAFEAELLVKAGGAVATVPRHPGAGALSSSFGEWQPGLRRPEGLRTLLEESGAPEPLAQAVLRADEALGGFRGERGIQLVAPWAAAAVRRATAPGIWAEPRHPYNGAWILGWAMISQVRAALYVDEAGAVWASWQDPADDQVEMRRVGSSAERWFERQLHLLEHGYASLATCTSEEALPPGAALRADLSDDAAQVFVEEGEVVWLVEEGNIQRMSRRVSSVEEVLAAAGRCG